MKIIPSKRIIVLSSVMAALFSSAVFAKPKIGACDSEGFISPACYESDMTALQGLLNQSKKLRIDGWVDLDAAQYTNYAPPTKLLSGAIIRAMRLNFSGILTPKWRYSAGVGLFNDSVSMKQAYIGYLFAENTELKIGQMKVPFNLEEMTNDKFTTFLEEALPVSALSPEYRMGLGVFHYGTFSSRPENTYTASGGIYTDRAGQRSPDSNAGYMGVGRVTYAFVPDRRHVMIFGVGGALQRPDSNDIVSYSDLPESRVSNNTSGMLVNTGPVTNVNYVGLYNVQTAGVYGPFSAQAEYIGDKVMRQNNNPNLQFKGWYALASWMITGESRVYNVKNGVFDGIEPAHHYGAWELAGRVSHINLNSQSILGGEEDNYTGGLNWYLNYNLRFMLNYIKAYSLRDGIHSNPSIYTVRAEADFP